MVNNEEDAQYTVVHIGEGRERTAALLDVASAMTGVGCIIHEAVIQVRGMPYPSILQGHWSKCCALCPRTMHRTCALCKSKTHPRSSILALT